MKYPTNAEVLQNYEKSGRIITLGPADAQRILQHARANFPEEACGLIAGTEEEDGSRSIKKVYLLTNTDHSREHFSLDPMEHLQAVKDMRKNGYVPLGNWHSHPESPSRPSEEDIRLSYDSNASYLILSLMEDEPVLRSFHIEAGRVTIETLEIK
jgi:proteasome lid subunit RPN8/RPN11